MSLYLISTLRSKPGLGYAIFQTFARLSLYAPNHFQGQVSIRILERFDMVYDDEGEKSDGELDDEETAECEGMGGRQACPLEGKDVYEEGELPSGSDSESVDEFAISDDGEDDWEDGSVFSGEESVRSNKTTPAEEKDGLGLGAAGKDEEVPIYKPRGKKITHLVVITEWESDEAVQKHWESSSFNYFTETIRPYISSAGTTLGSYTEVFSRNGPGDYKVGPKLMKVVKQQERKRKMKMRGQRRRSRRTNSEGRGSVDGKGADKALGMSPEKGVVPEDVGPEQLHVDMDSLAVED